MPSIKTAAFWLRYAHVSSDRCICECMLCMLYSSALSRDSTGSGICCSTGCAGGGPVGILGAENESRWMSACLEARRLISRKPTRSPRLKFPLPCLNSHSGESGDPVWKTSLTARYQWTICGLNCAATHLCEIHTCSTGGQKTICWYA